MALWLKSCIALAEDLNSVPNNHLGLQLQGCLHSPMHICKHGPTHIYITKSCFKERLRVMNMGGLSF